MNYTYDVSIVIVNYNVKAYLANLLDSIKKGSTGLNVQVIVIDNASIDGSIDYVEKRHPENIYIRNKKNLGFGRANNQSIDLIDSPYTLLLNPDTIIQENTLSTLIEFMNSNRKVGLATCRLLNADGSYSNDAIRNVPNLWSALMRILGITELFPNSKFAGSYFLAKEDPKEVIDVPVISGSFMFIRSELFKQLNGFDDRFFMYFEDTDLCFRVKEAGYEIKYVPNTSIIHFRGESTKKHTLNHHLIFNKALYQFYQKHYSSGYSFISRLVIYLGLIFRAFFVYLKSLLSLSFYPLIDLLILNAVIISSFVVRYSIHLNTILEDYHSQYFAINMMATLFYLSIGSYYSLYRKNLHSSVALFKTTTLTFSSVAMITFFLKDYAFSRLIIVVGSLVGFIILLFIRIYRRKRVNSVKSSSTLNTKNVLIVGEGPQTADLIQKIRTEIAWNFNPIGIVSDSYSDKIVEGVSIIGKIDDLPELVKLYKIDEVFFQMGILKNEAILSLIGKLPKNVFTRLVPDSQDYLLGKTNVNYFGGIPVVNIEIPYYLVYNRVLKRILDISVSLLIIMLLLPYKFYFSIVNNVKNKVLIYINDFDRTEVELNGKSHLFDLFQLMLQVLFGKISLIGAPIYLYQTVRDFPDYKPGLFGNRQLVETHSIGEKEKQLFEIYYIQNYAIWLDLEILFKSLVNWREYLNTSVSRLVAL